MFRILHCHSRRLFPPLCRLVQVSCGTSTLFRNSYLTASDDIKPNPVSPPAERAVSSLSGLSGARAFSGFLHKLARAVDAKELIRSLDTCAKPAQNSLMTPRPQPIQFCSSFLITSTMLLALMGVADVGGGDPHSF